jgi:hypothetical protein
MYNMTKLDKKLPPKEILRRIKLYTIMYEYDVDEEMAEIILKELESGEHKGPITLH